MIATYRLADRMIQVSSENARLHEMLAEYRADGTPDFSVQASCEDIAFEREQSNEEDALEGREPRAWSDAYLETLAVYRQIAERMPAYDTVLFHGSVVAVDGVAYLFAASSGTGKSTHARLWRELFGDRAVMVNDDKPLIRISADGATAYGTPWDGKHHLSSNVAMPLKAMCILERATENHIAPVAASDALPQVLRQCYRPAVPAALLKTLSLIDRLMLNVGLYRMGCNKDIEAARMAYEVMR